MNHTYTLKNLLDALSSKAKKRIIYDNSAVGGLSSSYLKLIFLALPFIEYALIFNPTSFAFLGIAQAIIFFIVFLSIVMIVVFLVGLKNNQKVLKKIEPIWQSYFPDVDLAMVLTSGITPYKEFFNEYAKVMNDNLDDKALHMALNTAFDRMKADNQELLEMMNRAKADKR